MKIPWHMRDSQAVCAIGNDWTDMAFQRIAQLCACSWPEYHAQFHPAGYHGKASMIIFYIIQFNAPNRVRAGVHLLPRACSFKMGKKGITLLLNQAILQCKKKNWDQTSMLNSTRNWVQFMLRFTIVLSLPSASFRFLCTCLLRSRSVSP